MIGSLEISRNCSPPTAYNRNNTHGGMGDQFLFRSLNRSVLLQSPNNKSLLCPTIRWRVCSTSTCALDNAPGIKHVYKKILLTPGNDLVFWSPTFLLPSNKTHTKRVTRWGFPGCPGLRTPRSQCPRPGFDACSGN